MRNRKHAGHGTLRHFTTAAALVSLVLLATGVLAQAEDHARLRDRDQDQTQGGSPDRDQLQDRLRERIDQDPTLSEPDRTRLREHLHDCLATDLDASQVEALFTAPAGKGLGAMMNTQERVLDLARAGLPADLVAEKLREGRMKRAGEAALEGALQRVQENIRHAHRFLQQAEQDGVAAHPDAAGERHLMRGVALNLWRGLQAGDLDLLRQRARDRLRDHACGSVELAAASETACQLQEMGVDRGRAVKLAGEALQHGYTARELRQIGWAVMSARMHGGPPEDVLGHLENGFRHGETIDGMFQHMMQQGWMGEGDGHYGHGGHGPVDDVIGGGPGGPGGGPDGEDGHHGGQHGNG